MKTNCIFEVICLFVLIVSNAAAQGDFFFSFVEGGANSDQSAAFEVGDAGSLYVYWSTNGPANSDLSVGAIIDVVSATDGVIEFTAAETFDYQITSNDVPIGNRLLDAKGGGGLAGPTQDVGANYIESLVAVTITGGPGILESNNGSGTLLDLGYDASNDGFNWGRIDFNVIGEGTTKVAGFCHDGDCTPWVHNKVFPEFTTATITVISDACPSGFAIGDVNQNGAVNLLDVDPFLAILTSGSYLCEADIDQNGIVDLLDVDPFVVLLVGP